MSCHSKKYTHYANKLLNRWCRRTKEQKEIDYLEEENGMLTAYEFKWSERIRVKEPKLFLNTYQDSQFKVVHRENFEDFLLA